MQGNIIEISKRGIKLKISNGLLLIIDNDDINEIPISDIATVIFSESAISLTGTVLSELATNNIATVICDRKYRPNAIMFPLGYTSVHNTLHFQVNMRPTLKKKLWKELIRQKINNQARVLKYITGDNANLNDLALKVLSGDKSNVEAQAAVLFWKSLPFIEKRDKNLKDINILFNYAYMVLWSIIARGICATGLHPNLGIFHKNKYNPFNLASDIIEPYRFLAEIAVYESQQLFDNSISPKVKNFILETMFHSNFIINNKKMKLFEGINCSVASIKKSICSNTIALHLPQLEKT